ncbi:MAG: DUF5908 family protein [Ginsengibacter sp.]
MPVQINELVIKANLERVNATDQKAVTTHTDQNLAAKIDEIILAELVTDILKEKKER